MMLTIFLMPSMSTSTEATPIRIDTIISANGSKRVRPRGYFWRSCLRIARVANQMTMSLSSSEQETTADEMIASESLSADATICAVRMHELIANMAFAKRSSLRLIEAYSSVYDGVSDVSLASARWNFS